MHFYSFFILYFLQNTCILFSTYWTTVKEKIKFTWLSFWVSSAHLGILSLPPRNQSLTTRRAEKILWSEHQRCACCRQRALANCTSGHAHLVTLRTCQAIDSNTNFAVNTVFTHVRTVIAYMYGVASLRGMS